MSALLLILAGLGAPFAHLGGAPDAVYAPEGWLGEAPSFGRLGPAAGTVRLVPVDPLDVAGGGLAEGARALEEWVVRVAGGEYEPAACAVLSDRPVALEWSVPEGLCAEVRLVRPMPLFDPTYKVRSWGRAALCRLEEGEELPAGGALVWLTVWCPPGTPAGEREIRLAARCGGERAAASLRVVARGFDLAPPSRAYFFYYHVDTRWVGFHPENWRKHLDDMREHGLNGLTVYARPRLARGEGGLRPTSREPAPNCLWSLEEFLQAVAEAGFDRPLPFIGGHLLRRWDVPLALEREGRDRPREGWEGDAAFDALYLAAVNEALLAGDRAGVTLALSTVDEAGIHLDRRASSLRYLALFKRFFPGALTYQTLNGRWYSSPEELLIGGWLDLRCYNWLDEATLRDTLRAGARLWLYNGGSGGTGYGEALLYSPPLDRFFFGFYAVKTGADGVGQWAYQYPRRMEVAPWQEVARGVGTGYYYTYPSREGPVPTVCWEMVREGIDDARYADTLVLLAGDEGAEEMRRELRSLLEWVPLGHQTHAKAVLRPSVWRERGRMAQTRERIAALIEERLAAQGSGTRSSRSGAEVWSQ